MVLIAKRLAIAFAILELSNCTIARVSYKKRADLPDADICASGRRSAPLNYNVFTSDENDIHVSLKISWERHSIWLFASIIPLFGLVQDFMSNSVEIKVTNNRKKPILLSASDIRYFVDASESAPLENSPTLNDAGEILQVRVMPGATTEMQLDSDKSMMGKARLARIRFTDVDAGMQLNHVLHIQETNTICTWAINR